MGLLGYHLVHKNGSKDSKGITHHVYVYEVVVDSMNDDPGDIALFVPGNVFTSTLAPSFPLARLKKKTASMVSPKEDGSSIWQVTLEFDSEPTDQSQAASDGSPPSGDSGQGSSETQPDLRPPTIDIDSVEVKELRTHDLSMPALATGTATVAGTTLTATTGIFTAAMVGKWVTSGVKWRKITAYTSATVVTIDFTVIWVGVGITVVGDGKKVMASNSQPFIPPLEVSVYHPQITITLFKAIGDDAFSNSLYYTGNVNNDVFWGFSANQLLCKKYKLTTSYEHNAWWWNKTLVLEGKLDGWNPIKILDCGTYTRESDGKFKPIRDRQNQPVTEPVPLNGFGHVLAFGDEPVFLEFQGYRYVSYAGIA